MLLEAAAHVGVEDLRLHLAMGQVAVALYDNKLLHEARRFFRFFKFDAWQPKFDQLTQSRLFKYDFLMDGFGLSAPR